MLGHRDLTFDDYRAIVKRRLLLILSCGVVVLGIGFAISFAIPPLYVSQTLILVEQQRVPSDYVMPVITEDLGARLASMKEQILSRSRLEPIIQRFNLFAGRPNTMDERIALTQKAIGVRPIPSSPSSHGMPGFYISFTASDARTAQQVCEEITSLFVSENLHAREQSATGTTDFLKQQLAESKKTLDEQDAKLAEFERKYMGRLPDQQGANQSTLQALTTQLDASTQSLGRMQQSETFLQAMVTQEERQVSAAPGAPRSPEDQQKELDSLIRQKEQMAAVYTPDHPDLIALSRKIDEMKKASAPALSPAGTPADQAARPGSSHLEQQRAQLRSVQQGIAAAKRSQAEIERQIQIYEARIESTPLVEAEYKQITRDHDVALQFYNSLLKKMNESSMATALEQRQQGEQFRVMDAPNLPDSPSFPNRTVFAGAGFACGVIIGLLVATFLEYSDDTMRTELDVSVFTKLPTLAVIGHLQGLPKEELPKKKPGRATSTDSPTERATA